MRSRAVIQDNTSPYGRKIQRKRAQPPLKVPPSHSHFLHPHAMTVGHAHVCLPNAAGARESLKKHPSSGLDLWSVARSCLKNTQLNYCCKMTSDLHFLITLYSLLKATYYSILKLCIFFLFYIQPR